MSYRRKNQTTDDLRNFKKFCQDNFALIEKIGLPSLVIEDYKSFVYLLMHGALWPNAPIRFNIEDLDEEKRKDYLLLFDRYIEAGFGNPGFDGFIKLAVDETSG